MTSGSENAELYRLLDEFSRRLQQGEDADVESFIAKHALHANDLRRLLPAAIALASLGGSNRSIAPKRLPSHDRLPFDELGDFRLLREIGRGGMGIVYEARQISLDRSVALKILPFAAVLDPRNLQRFRNEARAAATLDHAHIVAVYSVGEDRGVPYYAMQLINGRSLAEIISDLRNREATGRTDGAGDTRRTGRAGSTAHQARSLTDNRARHREHCRQTARWGIQAARALEHAHQLGIVHRDIKPSNLLVDAAGHLWIADFGLALTRQHSELTMTGEQLGTLRYMSPEQIRGERGNIDERTDIYSLGATLFELLTLRPAFPWVDRQQLLQRIVDGDFVAIQTVCSDLPVDLETIICKALAKEPARRYRSGSELADDLERYLSGHPISARRSSVVERSLKWVRRHPARAAFAATVVATAIGIPTALALHLQQVQALNVELVKQTHEAETNARLHLQSAEAAEQSAATARQNARESRLHAYVATVAQAAASLNEGNLARAESLLARWIPEGEPERAPDVRGFEWGALWNHRGRYGGSGRMSPGHPRTRVLGRTGYGGRGKVRVAYWENGLKIATLEPSGSTDVRTLPVQRGLPTKPPVWIRDVAGDRLAVMTSSGVELWDVDAEELLGRAQTSEPAVSFAISLEKGLFAWYARDHMHVCRWPGGEELHSAMAAVDTPTPQIWIGHEGIVFYQHHEPMLWMIGERSHALEFLGNRAPIATSAVSPSGRSLATSDLSGRIEIRSLPSGRIRQILTGAHGTAASLDFLDDDRLASSSGAGYVQTWELGTGRELGQLHWTNNSETQVVWNVDGTIAACSSDGTLFHGQFPAGTVLKTQSTAVGPLAVSHDGRMIAFADDAHQVWLVNGDMTTPPDRLDRDPWPVVDLQFSPGGERLAVIDDRRYDLWDVASRDVLWGGSEGLGTCARFSANGEILAVGRRDGDVLLVTLTGDSFATRPLGRVGPAVSDLALFPDADWIAVAGGTVAPLIHSLRGKMPVTLPVTRLVPVERLALDVSTCRLYTRDAEGIKTVYRCQRLPEISERTEYYPTFPHALQQSKVFDALPARHELFLDFGQGISIIDPETATEVWHWGIQLGLSDSRDPAVISRNAGCSFDGRYVFVITTAGQLLRWDRARCTIRSLPNHGLRHVRNLAFFDDGRRLLAGTDFHSNGYTREDKANSFLRMLANGATPIISCAHPWDRSSDSVRAWNLEDGHEISPLGTVDIRVPHFFVAASDACRRLVTAGDDGSVWIWDRDSGQLIKRVYVSAKARNDCAKIEFASRLFNSKSGYDHGEDLKAVAISRDGRRLAGIGEHGGLRVWSLGDGAELLSTKLELGSDFLAWSADDRWLITNAISQVRFVDSTSGGIGFVAGHPQEPSIRAGAISKDGTLLATVNEDRMIRLWHLDDGAIPRETKRLQGHIGMVLSLAFSHDGRTLVSGSADGVVKFWNLEVLEEVAQITTPRGGVNALQFSPDGRYLAVGGSDRWGNGEVQLWDGKLPAEVRAGGQAE